MSRRLLHDPQVRFRESINDLRIVGGLFCLLGIIPFFVAMATGSTRAAQLLMAATGILLIGPGVWYNMAASYLKRRQMWIIRITLYIALAQVAAVLGLLMLSRLFRFSSADYFALQMPVILLIFFLPAILALIWNLRQLEGLAAALLPTGTAFEPVNVQHAQAIEPMADTNGGPDEPAPKGDPRSTVEPPT